MPLAKIHVVEGRYDQARIAKLSGAVQAALMNTLGVPPDDFYQLIFGHCHAASGLRSRWRFCSQGDEENQLSRLPLSARDHPAVRATRSSRIRWPSSRGRWPHIEVVAADFAVSPTPPSIPSDRKCSTCGKPLNRERLSFLGSKTPHCQSAFHKNPGLRLYGPREGDIRRRSDSPFRRDGQPLYPVARRLADRERRGDLKA